MDSYCQEFCLSSRLCICEVWGLDLRRLHRSCLFRHGTLASMFVYAGCDVRTGCAPIVGKKVQVTRLKSRASIMTRVCCVWSLLMRVVRMIRMTSLCNCHFLSCARLFPLLFNLLDLSRCQLSNPSCAAFHFLNETTWRCQTAPALLPLSLKSSSSSKARVRAMLLLASAKTSSNTALSNKNLLPLTKTINLSLLP